ncbi:TetM/TetW/TetO/TetS family tetracycline resistance ribosomal protection protein [Acetivibrio thermocellus]|uniref:translation factor GTPase family protein n=1 Tax=Acetivibrio thermocellus TaxID=1515 RepID=UPI0003B8D8EA|nr:TetM/TetW/TetO/TetS family tetracycline resistance ribosomal protection protein [Acetivibrio thermocellus]THJ77248.1 GTP-binding protein [Acetivibrio thermocellus]UWV46191.1 TetM/TetW/TetO/TetS family tetracycline resistance ribosomal protection protein [Acetivibrio thermocellus]CDG34715.1 small GTP-binding protein [Acetivibrio thermocellus BC1]HOP92707.1 TetM/TetW/TetO/TetS family tetracycline resistance ribosomal protection protein [Acetivibrio thermocellus]
MKKLVVGILAHVDAGKTTLSEALLYVSGKIRKLGRVDNKDAYLDTYELERARGITIFSKQAVFEVGDTRITLLDTPGHVDFSAEMERTLQVLDYAILVVSGADGVQGHTKTLWHLLEIYKIPVFIFVNKMDQNGTNKDKVINEIKKQLDDRCIEFSEENPEEFFDRLAMCDEMIMETYLEKGRVETSQISAAVKERKVFPCFFGSALKLEGVEEFIHGLMKYTVVPSYPNEFGAKIFKITRDEQGNRLTHMKLTGGKLKVRDVLTNGVWEEKVNQIRIYSGEKFEAVSEVDAGTVFAVTGLTQSRPGEGLGIEKSSGAPLLEPVLQYQIILPEGCDPRAMLPKLRQIEDEEPELNIVWDEQLQEIRVRVMGEVQIEILQSIIKSRFGVDVAFDDGSIVYKETIANTVEGVGHFEPLRHYAEVHLLLEPGERGSGLKFDVNCSEDVLAKSWQRLVLTHLEEKVHKGVLTGSAITDMKITLVSGRAHNKHTQGGDFREATYRAVRQGLKEAESILLEPYYDFQLEVPEKMVGRAMMDIEKMHGTCEISQINGDMAVLVGSAPVVTMRNYQKEVVAYTKGLGRLFCSFKGYEPCHNAQEVIERIGYDSERDVENPTGSVFCANGVSFLVSWDEVKNYMHVESYFQKKEDEENLNQNRPVYSGEKAISLEEIDQIMNKTFYANQGRKSAWKRQKASEERYYKPAAGAKRHEAKEEYLLVDGYNIIYAWPELKKLADENLDGARMKLLDMLSNYQWIRRCHVIVVFDAYRVEGHKEEIIDYYNIHVVYTREAQTADQYIEKFAYENSKNYDITVATSDGLQQIIVRGEGCALLSARELKAELEAANERIKQEYHKMNKIDRNYLGDALSTKAKRHMEDLIEEENKNNGIKKDK